MTVFTGILFLFLIVCAVAASLSKSLLNTVLIFMTYSLVMTIIWVTTVLFVLTLKKIHAIMGADEADREEELEYRRRRRS